MIGMVLCPNSSSARSSERCARLSAEVKPMSNRMPCALSLRPAARASLTPISVRSMSRQPVNRLLRFHSLWPWRRSTSSRSVIIRSLSKITQAENIGHRIESRFPPPRPQRRLERPAGEDHAVLRLVHELETLGRAGKDHAMVADHGAAAQRRKSDVARAARAGLPVATSHRALGKIDAAPLGGGAAEHQRRARGRVDFLVVVHFEYFDVEILVERLRHPLDQRPQEID